MFWVRKARAVGDTLIIKCEWVPSSPGAPGGLGRAFCTNVSLGGPGPERLQTGMADDCICGASLRTLNAPWGGRRRPGLGGAFQSALASFDHFSQGKPIKKSGPSPSSVYKTTNSCPVSVILTPRPWRWREEPLSIYDMSAPLFLSLTISNTHILHRVYYRAKS